MTTDSQGNVDSISYLPTQYGGTGTTTSPSAGQILYSPSGTTYTPTTFSTLPGLVTSGVTGSRPASPTSGQLYYNTSLFQLEVYSNGNWYTVALSPSAPTIGTATDQPSGRAYNNGQASITFTPATNGGAAASYTITSSPGSYTGTGSSSPILVTGLQSSTQYTYSVTATNNYGTSSASSSTSNLTATTVPQAPTMGTATGADSSVLVTFTAGATGGSTISNYKYSLDGTTYTAFSPAQNTSPLTISGLTNNNSYSVYLKAVNANGDSAASSVSNTVTAGIPIVGSYDALASVTVPSGGVSSVTFAGIPTGYSHLQIRGTYLNSSAGSALINLNGDTTNTWPFHQLYGTGSSAVSNASTTSTFGQLSYGDGSSTAPVGFVCDILDYANNNKYKTFRTLSGNDTNGAGYILLRSNLWQSTSAITSMVLTAQSGSFAQYSSFALYGVK